MPRATFPRKYADMDWDGMNMQPPKTAWQDMDMGQRYDLLRHALDESIWSLEPSAKWDEPGDSQKLAIEFVKEDVRQATPGFRADAFDAVMTRLEAFADEFARLARTKEQTALAEKFGEFVGDEAHTAIAWLAEVRRDTRPEARVPLPSPADIAGDYHRDEIGESETGMSKKELKALFAEWEEDYAARRAEDSQQRLRSPLPSPERGGGHDRGR